MISREKFRTSLLTELGISFSLDDCFDLEWENGHYCPKSKRGLQVLFGKRTLSLPVDISANIMEPPTIADLKDQFSRRRAILDEVKLNRASAVALKKLSGAVGAALSAHQGFDEVSSQIRGTFREVFVGPKRPYKPVQGSWTAYEPNDKDFTRIAYAYHDGLLVRFGFWCETLTSIQITDSEAVEANDQSNSADSAAGLLQVVPRPFPEAMKRIGH
jgi:hypothetical protein